MGGADGDATRGGGITGGGGLGVKAGNTGGSAKGARSWFEIRREKIVYWR